MKLQTWIVQCELTVKSEGCLTDFTQRDTYKGSVWKKFKQHCGGVVLGFFFVFLQRTLFKTLATSCLTSVYWLVLVKFPYLGYIKYVLCLIASSDMENWSLLWVSLDHLRLKVNARNHKTEKNPFLVKLLCLFLSNIQLFPNWIGNNVRLRKVSGQKSCKLCSCCPISSILLLPPPTQKHPDSVWDTPKHTCLRFSPSWDVWLGALMPWIPLSCSTLEVFRNWCCTDD